MKKYKQKCDYDKGLGVKNVPFLLPETCVWIDAVRYVQEGQIDRQCEQPRSYIVATARVSFQKNRRVTIPMFLESPRESSERYITRYGGAVKCPQGYPI